MTASVEDSAVQREATPQGIVGMEEDEDLFEIDLEAVNAIPPPHYWESYNTSTGSALLANCLLPISDISDAVPACSSPVYLAGTTEVLGGITEPISLGEYLRLPFLGALELLNQEMQTQPFFMFERH